MSIKIVELGKYTTPKISETKKDKWVSYGDDNNYYQTLLDSKESPTNSALINSISDMIYGKGLGATDASRKPDEWAALVQMFSEDLMRKIADDYYTLGEASIQVVYDQSHSTITSVEHIPIQNLRPERCNEEGDIEAYYYSDDWTKVKRNETLERIPSFGMSKEGLEVLVLKPYKSGFHYFSPVEYQSGLDYAFVEIELAKFHLNNIYNRFSANMIINFNNGQPNDEQQRAIENKIKDKYTGTEGESVIVSFNDNKESAADIQTPQLNDAHNQYQFIAEEASRKLMVSHRVTSPLLFGLPQNGGLGSNAEEIKMAAMLFDNTVIKPMQRVIIEGVNKILNFNQISLNLYMITSQPLDFTELNNEDVGVEAIQEQTGIEMSKQICCSNQDDGLDQMVDKLIDLGEDEDLEDWDLISSEAVDYLTDDEKEQEQSLLSKVWNFVSTGTARPNQKSEQDTGLFKVRYQYAPDKTSGNSRDFCKKMVSASKIYRKEDIIAMDNKVVNAGWGPNGADTYSIWFYKGGGDCHHYWMRKVYMRKRNSSGVFLPNEGLSNDKPVSVNEARKAGVPLKKNDAKVAKLPTDMENNGFLKPRG